ncbi:hypothetical protein [Pedobacter ureilyticus]|uniref:Uncharacterized protein n=1 Tax=Pedobacter ureilyticus TaxID=1393051 RepID=A0ABW9J848_9SPHI|nr:hypothetical protein [Pedobacter helvus]
MGKFWEPGMVQLPDGEIQFFFANELDNKNANTRPEQKVLLIRSKDIGQTCPLVKDATSAHSF